MARMDHENTTTTETETLSAAEAAGIWLRIAEVRERLRQHAGDSTDFGSPQLEDDPRELLRYLEHMLAYHEAPFVTIAERLKAHGEPAPRPLERLSSTKVHRHLWKLIHSLARVRIILNTTDHLSDRELYKVLIEQVLPDEIQDFPITDDHYFMIDVSDYEEDEDEYDDDNLAPGSALDLGLLESPFDTLFDDFLLPKYDRDSKMLPPPGIRPDEKIMISGRLPRCMRKPPH